ncbi:MAG: chromosomal replication initiator protein DnaA [Candidatus Aureabacteria bacterium]|nr:chromosomal replication initiator protein DnaA [Candidatus Auribacterota bacterium]
MDNLWRKICKDLEKELTAYAYDDWIKPLRPISFNENQLTLSSPIKFHANWVKDHYLDSIKTIAKKVTDNEIDIEFVVSNRRDLDFEEKPVQKKRVPLFSSMERKFETNLKPTFTFENFVVGDSNRLANAVCTAVVKSPGTAYNPLFIYGTVGLGKTHLLHAIGNQVIINKKRARVYYTTSESFGNQMIEALQNKTMVKFREKYRRIDVLLIDDIQFLGGKEMMQEEFFHTFNALYDAGKQVVVSSDRPPDEIPRLENRLVNRFEMGFLGDIQIPNLETRIAILREKRKGFSIKISDEIITFIAERIKSNVRKLEGALKRLAAYVSLDPDTEITAGIAEQILGNLLTVIAEKNISMESIQKKIAEYYDIRVADMQSKKKPQQIAFPRQVAMYLSRMLTKASLPEIGNSFGGRDHTTVMYAVSQIQKKIDKDKNFSRTIEMLTKKISAAQ